MVSEHITTQKTFLHKDSISVVLMCYEIDRTLNLISPKDAWAGEHKKIVTIRHATLIVSVVLDSFRFAGPQI